MLVGFVLDFLNFTYNNYWSCWQFHVCNIWPTTPSRFLSEYHLWGETVKLG